MKRRNTCRYAVQDPKYGTWICALLENVCNLRGTKCLAYQPHTKETKAALERVLKSEKGEEE